VKIWAYPHHKPPKISEFYGLCNDVHRKRDEAQCQQAILVGFVEKQREEVQPWKAELFRAQP